MKPNSLYKALLFLCVCAFGTHNTHAQLVQKDKLAASDAAAKNLGQSISIHENWLLVGAGYDELNNATNEGAAFIYEKVDNVWIETAILFPSNVEQSAQFGNSVSIYGDRALVGAFTEGVSNTGAAYIFEYINGAWVETAKLTASDAMESDAFGNQVSLYGDRALIGTKSKVGGVLVGTAYIFDLINGEWTQIAKLEPDELIDNLDFAHSVSLSEDRALIGAIGDNDRGTSAGTAYIFELINGEWTQTTKLFTDELEAEDRFGYAVSLLENRALVSAIGDGDNGAFAGAAYVFEYIDGTWTEVAKLKANDGVEFDILGFSASLSENLAVLGAINSNIDGIQTGAAYTFGLTNGEWTQTNKLFADDTDAGDLFGWAVASSGDEVFVGSFLNDNPVTADGAVYVYGPADADDDGYSDEDELACSSDPNDPNRIPVGTVSGSVTTGSTGIGGITVKLLDALDPTIVLASATTDAEGNYTFADIPQGDVQVMIVEPLGFSATSNNVDAAVTCNLTTSVDFPLDELILVNNAMRVSYWKHQFDLAVAGQPTTEDLSAIIDEIQDRFTDPHFNSLFADMGDGVDDELEWKALLSIRPSGGIAARAKAELAGLVMNVMAQKIAQLEEVTADGRYAADVITYAAQLLEDTDTSNDATAKSIAAHVNRQLTIAAGVVPVGNIVYAMNDGMELELKAEREDGLPESFALESNYPNPFNPSTAIRFSLPESAHVSLVVYNTLGQVVGTLVDGMQAAGHHQVQFEAGELPSGMYVYSLQTPAGTFSKTMLLLK